MQCAYNSDTGRAAAFLDQVNRALIRAAGERRMGHGGAPGDRLPASVAGGRVSLEVLTGVSWHLQEAERGRLGVVKVEEVTTELGAKTARRAVPRILAAMDPADPRRVLCNVLADTAERVGSVKGALSDGGGGGFGGVNDGGATTRIKHAARLRVIEALVNGWEVMPGGRIEKGAPRLVLAVQRRRGKRLNIKAFHAIVALAVEGQSLSRILRVHGWDDRRSNRQSLASGVLEVLDDAAEGYGLGRWGVEKGLDR